MYGLFFPISGVYYLYFARRYMLEYMVFGRPIIGKLADRYGVQKFLVPGILLIAAALLLLVKASSLPMFLLVGVIYGFGFGTVQPSFLSLRLLDGTLYGIRIKNQDGPQVTFPVYSFEQG